MKKENENNRELKNNNERICSFYASDYHFEMITMEYVKNMNNKNKNVVILTQDNLEESANKIVSKIDFKADSRKKILDIDWDSKNKFKLEKIKNDANNGKNSIVFVKGEKKFVKEMDLYMNNNINMNNVEAIHCFDMAEVGANMNDVVSNYTDVLNTSGKIKF